MRTSFGSSIDLVERQVTASKAWDTVKPEYQEAGLKTDCLFANNWFPLLYRCKSNAGLCRGLQESSLNQIYGQLFTLFEDIRLEEIIKQERPGTKEVFAKRKSYYQHKFSNERMAHVTRGLPLDELFCLIYLNLQSDRPEPDFPRAVSTQLEQLKQIRPFIYEVFEAKSTDDITRISLAIVHQLAANYTDMIHDYFVIPIQHVEMFTRNTLFDELTRTDELANDDKERLDEDKNEYIDETFSTWHRENENSDRKQTFLQFELEVGTKTNMKGKGARETEDGDQAMGTIQGASGQTKNKDYSDLEALDKQENKKGQRRENVYGEENRDAVKLIKPSVPPTEKDIALYDEYEKEIEPYKRKLEAILKKTIEHKQNAPRKDVMAGRLSRKLLPVILDEKPRIFYKKTKRLKNWMQSLPCLLTVLHPCRGKWRKQNAGSYYFMKC